MKYCTFYNWAGFRVVSVSVGPNSWRVLQWLPPPRRHHQLTACQQIIAAAQYTGLGFLRWATIYYPLISELLFILMYYHGKIKTRKYYMRTDPGPQNTFWTFLNNFIYIIPYASTLYGSICLTNLSGQKNPIKFTYFFTYLFIRFSFFFNLS